MKIMQSTTRAISLMILAGVVSTAALAGPLPPSGTVTGPCTADSFKISTIETSPLDGSGVIYGPPAAQIAATGCQGVFLGNDYAGNWNKTGTNVSPIANIGALNDGLLNGEGGLLSPTWFQAPIGYPQSPMLDTDGDGNATDPGWIRLGKIETGGSFSSDTSTVGTKTLDIGDVLNVKMACDSSGCTSGTWSLETTVDIIAKVQDLLGRNAFDHLAFVLKSSDRFAVYDFDFNVLSAGLPGFDFTTPYSFTGSWDTNDFLNSSGVPQNISHLSIWARDPQPGQDVPEPGTLALLGLGLAAMGYARFRLSKTA